MCGITVIWRRSGPPIATAVVEAMTAAVAHRGPNGEGSQCFRRDSAQFVPTEHDNWQLAFGHRRLAILDLSDDGRQPMSYRDRFWITYNGEVFNFVELRAELAARGHKFRSSSDTEVVLASYFEWGPACFERFRGMWGLAIVDLSEQKLVISRDRLGIKPLYRYETDSVTYFASEIKQFAEADLPLTPHDGVFREYLLTGYEPIDATFFKEVVPVPPGTWYSADLRSGNAEPPRSYWHPDHVQVAIHDREEAAHTVRDSIAEAAKLQLRSDVPIGCALSGGLDSGTIAALIARPPTVWGSMHSFTVSFPGSAIDEWPHAKLIAETNGLVPHVARPTANDFLSDFDRLVATQDEPFGSLSQYAGFAVARLMREFGVPVTLNGQGGDETLLGYWQSYYSYLFGRLQSGRILTAAAHVVGAALLGGNAELLRQFPAMWRRYRTRTDPTQRIRLSDRKEPTEDVGRRRVHHVLALNGQARRLYELRELHLPRLLRWDDRNLMAHSVEGRYPFLDHKFIETALSCDESVFFHRGWTKEPLRRGMRQLMPPAILRRKTKNGFETPQADWLSGPLRPMIETWLGGDAPLWSYVEPGDVRQLASRAYASRDPQFEDGQALMRMLIADRWLRVCVADRWHFADSATISA
jgi:asparagine synthase (glutamine-hydrolysing)